MRIIKVFNDFINEELSPLTIYNTVEEFKKKGHLNRSDKLLSELVSKVNIFKTSEKYDNVYNIINSVILRKIILENTKDKYDKFVSDLLLMSKNNDLPKYYPLTFREACLYTSEDLISDQIGDIDRLTIGIIFNINNNEYKEVVSPFCIFTIDIPIWWDLKTETFKVNTKYICEISNEWLYDSINLFDDRKSAVKFRREVLLKLKDIIKSYKKDERLKYSYQEFLNVFGDFSTMREMDVMFEHIVNSISVNDLYRD